MSRLENAVVAVTTAVIAVTTWRNIHDMRKFEIVAIAATVVIMTATILRDLLTARHAKAATAEGGPTRSDS